MEEVGVLRDELIEQTPAVAEVLASPARCRLQARVTHVVDDRKAVEFLETLPGDVSIRRTAMAAGGSHLDAISTSKNELLPKKGWAGLTRKHHGIPLLTSS